jgi:hypothetical protein
MAEPSNVPEELDRLDARYRTRFAGQPRVTRDPEELEDMIAQLDRLGIAPGSPSAERAATLRDHWSSEIEAIKAAQAIPYALPVARLRTWSDLSISRYARGFAGQDRRTRDLGLLLEIQGDLEGVRNALTELAPSAPGQGLEQTLRAIDQQLQVHRTEVEAIRTARRTGAAAEQGSRLAQLANDQFEAYEWHFAGKSRLSRHPATLQRILASLDEIRRGMQSLSLSGFQDPNNTRNQGIVDQRIRSFTNELDQIRRIRASTPVPERATALGQAANDVFARYREGFAGKPRKDADLDLLNRLFELLWPIAREMDEIDAEHDIDNNSGNLRLVVDNLVMYAREYDAIRQAQSAPA